MFSLGCALSPGCFGCAGDAAVIAHIFIFLLDLRVVQEIFNFQVLFLEVVLELCEVADPFGFDGVVIAGESPGEFFPFLFWFEFVVLDEGFADVLAFHEVDLVEDELEVGGGGFGGFYFFYVDELEGVFGEFVVILEGLGVAWVGAGVPSKKEGMFEK